MKFLRSLGQAVLFAGTFAAVSAATVKDLTVVDFTRMPRDPGGEPQRAYEYSYGDWQGKKGAFQALDQGLVINLLGSKGGVGENRGLDFRKHTKARVFYVIGNRNQATSFGFSMEDRDGTNGAFDVPLQGRPAGTLQNVLLDLTRPARQEAPGKTPGLDLKKLSTWQVKGNFQSAPLEVLVVKIVAVTE